VLSDIEPLTRITELKINNKKADFPDDGQFVYSENHLIFSYEGVSLTAPEKVRYKYMLDGFDPDYEQTSLSDVKYTNIPAGTYTFLVKARNHDGVWNKEPASYTFTILPPFYQTIWFFLICLVVLVGLVYAFIRWRTSKIEQEKRILEGKVLERTEEINRQNVELAIKNKDITDSIVYARRIQEAILPPMDEIYAAMPQSFVLYMPKDIVSGDFYWFSHVEGKAIIAAADCTGHGVPGAFMSMIGHSLLNEIVNEKGIYSPDQILNKLREGIIDSLKQRGAEGESKDGMDIALCTIDVAKQEMQFAGANNPLYILRNGEILETKGDKQPIGIYMGQESPFTNHTFKLDQEDRVYIFSDGYADQFGGERGKKFMYKRFKELVMKIYEKDMQKQRDKLEYTIEQWRGDLEQLDDILVIGFKLA
jgi:serine phosphatase RsbU (regulator of sigma subunit)